MIDFELLRAEVSRHPYPLMFATISGAHLYGFPSLDSDYDLRGVHLLPAKEAVGLLPKREEGPEKGSLDASECSFYQAEYLRLIAKLEEAAAESNLPNEPTVRGPLNDFLVRVRLQSVQDR